MAPKADIQSVIFLIDSLALSFSYWANYCDNKAKFVGRSESGVTINHVIYLYNDN